jgi:predicted GNAT family acetyltransferase
VIRKLDESDRDSAVRLLMDDTVFNLYMLSNIEQLGFDSEYCEFWGDFATRSPDSLRGLLNRYMGGWSIYGQPDSSWSELGSVVDMHPVTATRLQDNPGGVASFLPYLKGYEAEKIIEEELMQLEPQAFRPQAEPNGFKVRRATEDDLAALIPFYANAGSMTRSRTGVERPLRDLQVWIAERTGVICSAALTNAELPGHAMIGGVFTADDWRNQGLGQAVCSALCASLLRDGKQPVLYWQDPAAGAVYRKLGFRASGMWRSVWLRRRSK